MVRHGSDKQKSPAPAGLFEYQYKFIDKTHAWVPFAFACNPD